MKVIHLKDLDENPGRYAELAEVLTGGGIVAIPGRSTYRLCVNVMSSEAVAKLSQSKRRVQNAPALVFISKRQMLERIVDHVPDVADRLMAAFWPGPLTIRFAPGDGLPTKVVKTIAKATGRIGVRIPMGSASIALLRAFGGPILVSSANRAAKSGAHSVAQVRKNFGNVADVLVDAGDLKDDSPSTIVDVSDAGWSMVREASIKVADIEARLGLAPIG
jgi:L-threonylcarbamoyladenylate synthase